jgi:hypothetical protein
MLCPEDSSQAELASDLLSDIDEGFITSKDETKIRESNVA